ncbi:hypothetical protein BDV97DRAFT_12862 [Delphinella strobiligena]|nr:hypothetical protein BDV97DRAFT_12862 [Delphinella strobiligena]
MPNKTWRADGGLQPAPPPPPTQITMFFTPPSPFFLLGNPPAALYPTAIAIIPPPPAGMFFALPRPAPPVVETLVVKEVDVDVEIVTKTKTKKKAKPSSKKEKKKKTTTKVNTRTPGTSYIFPKHHTSLHVIKDIRVWEADHDANFRYKSFNVGTTKSVGELIEDLVGAEGEEVRGWAVTEVLEKGDGGFVRDVTVEHGGDLAKKDLASMGWNQSRSACRPPVWLVLHKNE